MSNAIDHIANTFDKLIIVVEDMIKKRLHPIIADVAALKNRIDILNSRIDILISDNEQKCRCTTSKF